MTPAQSSLEEPTSVGPLRLSIILCTDNPRADYFERALKALARQTISADEFEYVIVDNNSSPPVGEARAAGLAARRVRVVREPRQGLAFARITGIGAPSAPLLCFVDDDNEIAPDYFAEAMRIAETEPTIGALGGIATGELEKSVGPGFSHFLPHLGVNDHGPEPLNGPGDAQVPWAPIGTGLCVRREVAERFAEAIAELAEAGALSRRGELLMSGEDTLFSRLAHQLGYAVGYRPTQRLTHLIAAERLTLGYLARLMEGRSRSRSRSRSAASSIGCREKRPRLCRRKRSTRRTS